MQQPSKMPEDVSVLFVPSTSRVCRNLLIAHWFKTKVVEHTIFGQKCSNDCWNSSQDMCVSQDKLKAKNIEWLIDWHTKEMIAENSIQLIAKKYVDLVFVLNMMLK